MIPLSVDRTWAALAIVALLLAAGCAKQSPPADTEAATPPVTAPAATVTVGADREASSSPTAAREDDGAGAAPPAATAVPSPSASPLASSPSGRVRLETARESCTRSCVRAHQMQARAIEAIEADCLRDCTADPRSWPK